jgi:hypothetical protein
VVAKINDLIVNRSNGTVELAILTPAVRTSADKHRTTVAWSSLRFEGKPTPHLVTSLSPQELAAGTSFKQQAKSRDDFYDVKTDLLGKSVTGRDGSHIGTIQDLVLSFGNGHLAAVVIDTGWTDRRRTVPRRGLGQGAASGREGKLLCTPGSVQVRGRFRPGYDNPGAPTGSEPDRYQHARDPPGQHREYQRQQDPSSGCSARVDRRRVGRATEN